MRRVVAVVSYFSKGAFGASTENEDHVLSDILTEEGISTEIVPWSDPEVDWSRFSMLLIKSPWDYFDYYEEFLNWIQKISALDIPVLNSLEILIWNSNKKYLLEIEEKGFKVISGQLLPKGEPINWSGLQSKFGNEPYIIKPLVSGGAKNTFKIGLETKGEVKRKVDDLILSEGFLAQPFVPEIETVGEYSLIFFNSVFSHAVLKSPAKSDFRVQHYFGGTISVIEPSNQLLSSCQKFVDEFCQETLYVRVDGVLIEGEFHLMELEMIEPYLFLNTSKEALKNYKKAIRDRLS